VKFLLAADNFTRGSGGAPRSAQELVRALLAAGHRVAVLEEGPPAGKQPWEGADLFRARLHGPLMPGDRDLRTVLLNPRWRAEVSALAAAFRPQLVITQGMLAPGAIQAARAARLPVAYFFRGYAPLCPLHFTGLDPEERCSRPECWKCLPPARKLKYPLVRAALELYDRTVPGAELIVANSHYVARLLARYWGARAEVVFPALAVAPAEAPANSPEGYLLFVKPQRAKGLELVVELARSLPERSFAVAGEVGRGAAAALGALANVKLLGWREDMAEVYRGARLVLGPSRMPEPFGRVFAEAAAVGCPVLAFRTGGIPEAVGDGGLLLERTAGAGEWRRALEALDEPERYADLQRAALRTARETAARSGPQHAVRLMEEAARRGPAELPAPPDPGRRLKVVQVISALDLGGAELSLFHLASRLSPERFDVEVICLREEGEMAGRFRAAGLAVRLHRLRSRYSPGGLLGLARLFARAKADVVHTHLRRPNTSGRIAAWLAGVPVIIAHERNPGPEKRWRHFLVDRLLARASSTIVAVSRDTAERNSEAAGLDIERFTVIPNAVDLEQYRPGDRGAARERLGLDAGEFAVGFAGRLHPVKNLDVLLRAFAAAARERPDMRLLLAGDGPERAGLESLASEMGVAGQTTFLGRRDDLPEIYPAMDALCLVSKSEGCSRVMLEAAAMGLALVLTPVGYAPEMLADGESALMVPVGDEAALSAALLRLAADRGLRESLGGAARRAAEAHGLGEYVKRIERLYLELFARETADG
jgi:glycosyltransferase involved in cell wall biosynthesis